MAHVYERGHESLPLPGLAIQEWNIVSPTSVNFVICSVSQAPVGHFVQEMPNQPLAALFSERPFVLLKRCRFGIFGRNDPFGIKTVASAIGERPETSTK